MAYVGVQMGQTRHVAVLSLPQLSDRRVRNARRHETAPVLKPCKTPGSGEDGLP